jgi:hypothetical protein
MCLWFALIVLFRSLGALRVFLEGLRAALRSGVREDWKTAADIFRMPAAKKGEQFPKVVESLARRATNVGIEENKFRAPVPDRGTALDSVPGRY